MDGGKDARYEFLRFVAYVQKQAIGSKPFHLVVYSPGNYIAWASSARSSNLCMKRLPFGNSSFPPSPLIASVIRNDLAWGERGMLDETG